MKKLFLLTVFSLAGILFSEEVEKYICFCEGYEISDKYHPLSVGLSHLVHPKKGCYIGQEVLVRMVSRGRQGKKLVTVENGSVAEKSVTTPGKRQSLAIIRE